MKGLSGAARLAAAIAACIAIAASSVFVGQGCIQDLPSDPGPSDASQSPEQNLGEAGAAPDSGEALDAGLQSDAVGGPGCGDGVIDLEAGEQCDPGPGFNEPADGGSFGSCGADCKVRCRGGYLWPNNNHCYWLAGTAPILDMQAQNLCGLGHVVTFASAAELAAVNAGLRLSSALPSYFYWVDVSSIAGVRYVSLVRYEPGWTTTCSGCYAHSPDAAAPLPLYVDPEGGTSTQGCVVASSDPADPTWHQYPCAAPVRVHVVCEREPSGVQFESCDAGTCIDLVATFGRKHYVLAPAAASASAASQACIALGGRLVVLQTRDEREQLWFQLSQMSSFVSAFQRVWIGLSAVAVVDGGGAADGGVSPPVWTWDDGTAADAPGLYPSPWGDREPKAAPVGARAYLQTEMNAIDDTLARSEAPPGTADLPYVCELSP